MGNTIKKQVKPLPVMEVCREKGSIGLSFRYNRMLVETVRGLSKRWWDAKRKMWWVPNTETARSELQAAFKGKVQFVKTSDDEDPAFSGRPTEPGEPAAILEMRRKMEGLNYAQPTIKTYLNMFKEFMGYFPMRDPAYISEVEIRGFYQTLSKVKELTKTYKHQSVNAITFYYEKVVGREKMLLSIPEEKAPPIRSGVLKKGITPQLDDYLRSA